MLLQKELVMKNKYWISAIIALFLWGIHGPAGRYLALNNVDMNFVFSFRLWIGTIVFFTFLLLKKSLRFNWLEDWKQILFISAIGLVANTIVFHLTLKYLPGTFVMILESMAPIFVLMATLIIYGLKPKISEMFALIISFSGVLLIVMGKDSFPELSDHYYLGILLGILTGVTFGAYIFFSADLLRKYRSNELPPAPLREGGKIVPPSPRGAGVSSVSINVVKFQIRIMLIAAIVCTPFMLSSNALPSTPTQWFWILEMGIFQSGLAYLLWSFALVYIKANTASILFLLTILFTTINEVLFLNLKLNLYLIVGAVLICVATASLPLAKK